jgi:hypothetical protein
MDERKDFNIDLRIFYFWTKTFFRMVKWWSPFITLAMIQFLIGNETCHWHQSIRSVTVSVGFGVGLSTTRKVSVGVSNVNKQIKSNQISVSFSDTETKTFLFVFWKKKMQIN